jgi:carbon-monoxide dehydrogenase small subunit
MSDTQEIVFHLNGREERTVVPVRMHLVDFLREHYQLSSPRVGCEHGVCGACTMRVDGKIVRGCLFLAVQADGRKVETLEGINASGELSDLQDAFVRRNATQCGYCTSGMLITCAELLKDGKTSNREAIRDHLSGNICRCTGYESVIDAVESVIEQRRNGRTT